MDYKTNKRDLTLEIFSGKAFTCAENKWRFLTLGFENSPIIPSTQSAHANGDQNSALADPPLEGFTVQWHIQRVWGAFRRREEAFWIFDV